MKYSFDQNDIPIDLLNLGQYLDDVPKGRSEHDSCPMDQMIESVPLQNLRRSTI